jgi:hypothetical protein
MSYDNTNQTIKLTIGITNTVESTESTNSNNQANSLDLVDLEEEYDKYYQQKENDIEWVSQVLTTKFKKLDELYLSIDSINSQIHKLKNRLIMINCQLDRLNEQSGDLTQTLEPESRKVVADKIQLLNFYQITNDKISKLNHQISQIMEVIKTEIPMNEYELKLYETKKQKFQLNITKTQYSHLYSGLIEYVHRFPEKIKNFVIIDLMVQLSELQNSCDFLPELEP